jgi:hypothetical protein
MFVAKKLPQEVAKEKEILSMAALDAHVKFWAETFTPFITQSTTLSPHC